MRTNADSIFELIQSDGYAFWNDKIYKGPELSEIFKEVVDFSAFCNINSELYGIYSIYVHLPDEIYLYVSPGGFHKLFYRKDPTGFVVSKIASELSVGLLDDDALTEYRSSIYCWGEKTFYKGVNSVQPGYALRLSSFGVEKKKLFYYATPLSEIYKDSFDELKKKGGIVFEHVIDRMIKFLNGRQAVIPLSGGYDSRFILASLVSRGYTNIIAITYGKPEIVELENAEKTAKKLGVKWYFIPFTPDKVRKYIFENDLTEYFKYLANGNAFVSMHGVVTLSELKSKQLIEPDAVFIPGHSGDLLGGSQYFKVFPPDMKYKEIPKLLLKLKFDSSSLPKSYRSMMKKELTKKIGEFYSTNMAPSAIFEDIDLEEKITKHILNSSKVYTFYGYNYYFPYWDKELLNFFKLVPFEFKLGKKLYDTILRENYFAPRGISFDKELHPTIKKIRIRKIKGFIKGLLPKYFKKKLAIKHDAYLYHYMVQNWVEEMMKNKFIKSEPFSYNHAIANWIAYNVKRLG
jgi:asparagine synthase (glutamine-hydrolysing)